MTGNEQKALYIAEQCRKEGMTLAGCAGILANIEAESVFKSTNLEDTKEIRLGMNDAQYTQRVDNGSYTRFVLDKAGYGLCQWTASDRKDGMIKYHRQHGASIGDFRTQVDWMLQEIKRYTYAWRTCTMSNNPYECGYAVCKHYEICADLENQSRQRGGRAQHWYDFLTSAMQSGAVSEITEEEPRPEADPTEEKTDDEGIPIAQTWPPRTIDSNCTGWPEVKLLQTLLLCRGYSIVVDGIWTDQLTEKAKAFQKASGLHADGVVGPNTWAALGINRSIFR